MGVAVVLALLAKGESACWWYVSRVPALIHNTRLSVLLEHRYKRMGRTVCVPALCLVLLLHIMYNTSVFFVYGRLVHSLAR